MKQILFVFPNLGTGGVPQALAFVADTCVNAGYDTRIISLDGKEPAVNIDKKITVTHIDFEDFTQKSITSKALFLLSLRRELISNAPDLIIVFRADLVRVVTLALTGKGIPIIGSERGTPQKFSPRQMKKYSAAFKKCEHVVFQTEQARNCFCKKIQAKGVIIGNPCYLAKKMKIGSEEKDANANREKIILSCGRLSPEKNFVGLINAFCKVNAVFPDYLLRIYGVGPDQQLLEGLINERKLLNKVQLMGYRDDVFIIEQNSSMFVLNSLEEGMPNALIGAMSVGIPCVATNCPGGMQYLADNSRRVLLTPIADDEMLAQNIIMLLSSSTLQNELISNAMEIIEELSPDVISEKWLKLIRSVI